jgi:hypothetical protein
MGKKKNIPDYLKKSLSDSTVGGTFGIDDNDFVTTPKAGVSFGKGNTLVSAGLEKPISKLSKENINSKVSLSIKKGSIDQGDSSEFSLTAGKQGKNKNVMFNITKKLKKRSEGGMARGTGAAIRGKGFKGVF